MMAATRRKPPRSPHVTHDATPERRTITSASAPCATAVPSEHGLATGEARRPLLLMMIPALQIRQRVRISTVHLVNRDETHHPNSRASSPDSPAVTNQILLRVAPVGGRSIREVPLERAGSGAVRSDREGGAGAVRCDQGQGREEEASTGQESRSGGGDRVSAEDGGGGNGGMGGAGAGRAVVPGWDHGSPPGWSKAPRVRARSEELRRR
jgi:hypothetical protein